VGPSAYACERACACECEDGPHRNQHRYSFFCEHTRGLLVVRAGLEVVVVVDAEVRQQSVPPSRLLVEDVRERRHHDAAAANLRVVHTVFRTIS
jgi:hypothetical protein